MFENYAVAHRLGIGVLEPKTCINEMSHDEYDAWCAYFIATGESIRYTEKK